MAPEPGGPAWGKAVRREMEDIVYRNLGAERAEVRVGPRRGFDNAFVSVGGKRVLVVTTDPVSVIPRVGAKDSAWMSVHLIASDLATSGVAPQLATFSFNFPPEMSQAERRAYLRGVGRACADLGIAIVAGHTGSYPGAGYTVIGGGTMFGFAEEGRYVDPSMARAGDTVLMTKGAAIEATASLAYAFPEFLKQKAGARVARRAKALLRKCTTVADALAAADVGLGRGGVTSMHDATEGGVLGGIAEMSSASGRAFVVDPRRIHVGNEARAVCAAFSLDPLKTLSEGTLLLTCGPSKVRKVKEALRGRGIPSWEIGAVGRGSGAWTEDDGRRRRIAEVEDLYWKAYSEGTDAGLT